jgi:Stage II sporulation protein E (SpoIIE)
MSTEQPAREAFEPLGRLARRLLSVPTSLVTVIDVAGLPITCFLDEDVLGDPRRWESLSLALAELALASAGAVVMPDAYGWTCLAEPLVDAVGDVVGVFGVIDRHTRVWTDEDRTTLSDLSKFAAAEIERRDVVRLRAADDHSTEQLFQLAKALTAAADVQEVVHRSSRIAGDLVGASFANVATVDLEAGRLQLHDGAPLSNDLSERWPHLVLDMSSPLGRAVLTGNPVYACDPYEISRDFPIGAQDAADAGLQALAAYPTRRGQAALGFAWSHPVVFTGPLLRRLATVAELVGLGLERAAATDRDRNVADRLQRSLLPRQLAVIPGVQTACWYEAGAANLQVGGDWYDIVAAGPDRYIIGIGDVVGRGLHAAVTMGELRHAFIALVSRIGSLAEIVENLDQFALDVEGARLSTMVAASYEPSSGKLELISAGHMPPIVRRANGSVMQLPDGGPPLGLDTHIERATMHTSLGAGDSLWLYTDGLVERRGESIDVGLSRLHEAIGRSITHDYDEALRAVYDSLGRPIDDDVAAVVLAVNTSDTSDKVTK